MFGYAHSFLNLKVPAECVTSITGIAAMILVVALPFTVALTWLTVVLYRHSVKQTMSIASGTKVVSVSTGNTAVGVPPTTTLQFDFVDSTIQSSTSPLMQYAAQGIQHVGFAYVGAGIAHALVSVVLTFSLGDMEFLPIRFTSTLLLYLWPIIPALILIRVGDVRSKWALLVGYFAFVLLLDVGISLFGAHDIGSVGLLLLAWVGWMGIPSLLLWLLNNRAWRSVGLPAYLVGIGLVAAYLLVVQGLGCLAIATDDLRLWHSRYVVFLVAVAVMAMGVWWALDQGDRI